MDKETKQRILNEAIRIGDELLSLAEFTRHARVRGNVSLDKLLTGGRPKAAQRNPKRALSPTSNRL